MSKLSATHLFDALRSFQGDRAVGVDQPTPPLSVEKLTSFLEGAASPVASRLGPGDLARALRRTFDLEHDQIVADPSYLLDLPTVPAGRRLRLDS
ncbi:MAG TPA: hypothetical protein VHC22_23640, partial [Pirellulales bacterium]|nr:hypothetical protein [Pirellulales bacterium]